MSQHTLKLTPGVSAALAFAANNPGVVAAPGTDAYSDIMDAFQDVPHELVNCNQWWLSHYSSSARTCSKCREVLEAFPCGEPISDQQLEAIALHISEGHEPGCSAHNASSLSGLECLKSLPILSNSPVVSTTTPTQENTTMSSSSAISAVRFSDLPAAGEVFPGQGGVLAGIILGKKGEPSFALIRATDAAANFKDVELGTYGTEVENASHFLDGITNTKALAEAGSEICQQILQLNIEGHTDFYLPAIGELQAATSHIREQMEFDDYYLSSTQYGAHGVRVQDFDYGFSYHDYKGTERRAVAFRRIQLSDSVPE